MSDDVDMSGNKNSRLSGEKADLSKGCIQKKKSGKWGVVSAKSGYFWIQDYEERKDAEDALKAYHAQKNFDEIYPDSLSFQLR